MSFFKKLFSSEKKETSLPEEVKASLDKGLEKSKVIDKIIKERFPRIAKKFNMEIIHYGVIDNDGYIMYIEMKK